MKTAKVIFDDGIWRYEDCREKDVWGRKIYCAYFLGEFAGFRYKRTKNEIAKLHKKLFYTKCGISLYTECPIDCVA